MPGHGVVRRHRRHRRGARREGEGLGNKFLANIREADAICQVIRAFSDPDVVHVDGKVSPGDDIETINTELILADLQTIEKALPRLQKEARLTKDKPAAVAAVEEAQAVLETGQTVFEAGLDREPLRELHLMTAKPFLYVFNVDEDELANEELTAELRALVAPAEAIFLDAKIESELIELPDDEALELLQSMGQAGIRASTSSPGSASHTLGLQTYLTAGPKEARAWTIQEGRHRPAGGRRDPHRLRARASSRPRSSPTPTWSTPVRWPRPGPRARPASRARTT